MVEDYYLNGNEEEKQEENPAGNKQSPEDSPFDGGNLINDKKISDRQDNNISFVLFLILILLLLGDTDTFSSHFQLINNEVNQIKKMLEAVSITNDSLQNAVRAPRKVMQSLEI